ncbi:unnamed protein product [Choristocarpus tenellus]
MSRRLLMTPLLLVALVTMVSCFSPQPVSRSTSVVSRTPGPRPLAMPSASYWVGRGLGLQMTDEELGPEETTKKFGLEAGLFSALKSGGGEGATQAKDLLKRYGSAYLITSISLALVSFGVCYLAVSNGVDMQTLLSKFGITAGATAENAGTVAVAYAIHKAASPIRFPPTVALTPVVAKFLGKEEVVEEVTQAE